MKILIGPEVGNMVVVIGLALGVLAVVIYFLNVIQHFIFSGNKKAKKIINWIIVALWITATICVILDLTGVYPIVHNLLDKLIS